MAEKHVPHFDVAIVGLGVTGAATTWALSSFTNVKRVIGIEKYPQPAMVNSNPWNNAQTSHDGGTETNYTLPKALKVLKAALMLRAYVRKHKDKEGLFQVTDRMVLAVGAKEVAQLQKRLVEFQRHYPDLRLAGPDELWTIEPKVMEGRDPKQPVCALVSKEGYAINYQLLAYAFLEDAKAANPELELRFNAKVEKVTRQADGTYLVHTTGGTFTASVIMFAAGAYSLWHVQKLGYGLNLGILSVAGSFFSAGTFVRGKVYRPQVAGRPFAELHIDRDILNADDSRIGPTTKPIPLMERYHPETFRDYAELPNFSIKGFLMATWILLRGGLVWYVFMNALYDITVVGKWLFLRKAQDTIPTLRYRDLKRRTNAGGVRPQIVDMDTWQMEMGERTIIGDRTVLIDEHGELADEDFGGDIFEDRIIASTTPSPGASVCIYNAVTTFVPKVVEFLGDGFRFDHDAFERHLGLDQDERYSHVCETFVTDPLTGASNKAA